MRARRLFAAGWLLAACGTDPSDLLGDSGIPPVPGAIDAGSPDSGYANPGPTPTPLPIPGLPDGGIQDPVEPVFIDTCTPAASNLDDATIAQLTGASATGSGARVLYPYDGTVFPRGMEGPTVMWADNPLADAVYVRMTTEGFEYKGCGTPTQVGQFQVPPPVWEAAGVKTRGGLAPFDVEVTIRSGGNVLGPTKQRWTIARATLKGSIYYNTYSSLQGIPGTGKVMRIPPGGQAELYVANECNGCHSVSANGERLTSTTLLLGGRAFDISSGTPAPLAQPNRSAFVAMYPDGSRYVLPSLAVEVARSRLTAGVVFGDSALVDTATGQTLPSSGIPLGALMPSFSPDGRHLVFNDFAIANASGLAVVDFDAASNAASNYRVVQQDTGGARPGWPFFLPDNKAVVFARSVGGEFSGEGLPRPRSELYTVDLASGRVTIMAKAMGYNTEADAQSGSTYLPGGGADIGYVYFPTVSPVAAGGYFWVFFDSIRNYGNRGVQRQLWGTAVEIASDGSYAVDRSAPAFYVPGQEWGTGNHRAFTALDACKEDGGACESGVDCCGGFCTRTSEFGLGVCNPKKGCAKTDERCGDDSDCCPPEGNNPPNTCISGYCAMPLR